jgi:large subunit ribosomal protein L10
MKGLSPEKKRVRTPKASASYSDMDKEQKAAAVVELSDRLKEAESIFAVDYRGISVTGAAELRTRLREADAVFKVVKNRLAKRAVADAGAEDLVELLEGPTALTLIKGDPVTAAKAISTFAREHDVLAYKGGIMDGAPLDADGFAAIARLPSLEVLHGQLVGVTASPLTGLVRGLSSLVSGLAVALGQIAEQGLVSGEAPEPEAVAEEASEESAEADAAPAGASDEVAEAEAEPAAPSEAEPADTGREAEDVGGESDGREAEDVGRETSETETETDGEQERSDESEE